MPLFGLFAPGHVQEDPEHDPLDDARVGALAARRDPADVVPDHDPEVDLIVARHRAGGHESGPDAVAVGGMDVG